MRALVLSLLATGCGSLLGVHDFAGADAVVADGAGDAAPETCWDRWRDGSVAFGPVAPLAAIASTASDRDPWVSADGTTVFWSSSRAGTFDIWLATRGAGATEFANPTKAADLSSDTSDYKLTISPSGLEAIESRQPTASTLMAELVGATRQTTATAFGTFSSTSVSAIDDGHPQYDPSFARGGSVLYFATGLVPGEEIQRATRAGDHWSLPEIALLTDNSLDADPAPIDDERAMVFSSNRQGTVGSSALWLATRTDATGAFTDVKRLDTLDSDGGDGDPAFSPDGCTLYFASDRGRTAGLYSLYVATVVN